MNGSIIDLIRPDLRTFKAYASARVEATSGAIWLNANELPWPPSSDSSLNRYPDPQPQSLRNILVDYYQVESSELLISRGSDEGIDLLIRLFCQASIDAIAICPPTYGMYEISAKLQGADIVEFPLWAKKGFSLNADEVLAKWDPRIKILFLCSPNNPTGNCFDPREVLKLAENLAQKSIVVIDEAYIEFAKAQSFVPYCKDYKNLVVLRTLSKACGLAAVRCGVTLAHRDVIEWLAKIIAPYPINALTTDCIEKYFSQASIQENVKFIVSERERMASALSALPIVQQVFPSEANYLLIKTNFREALLNSCLKAGIVLRDMHNRHELTNCIRITIGKRHENNAVLNILRSIA